MKRIILILSVVSISQFSFAQFNNPTQTVYEKLCSINKEWLKIPTGEAVLMSHKTFISDEMLIQFHLQQVESHLRNTNTSDLSESQKAKRQQCLKFLNEYWKAGKFPKNTRHPIRTPYFIDDYGTYCAVGHLLHQTGYGNFARQIHDENNYAYIHEMNYPELPAWADEHGFSVEELAWIQPGYSTDPPFVWSSVNPDVQGTVQTITVDETNQIVYVAADFGNAGNNIMSFDGVEWNDMDGGVNGTVYVIVVQNGTVYAGGSFSSAGSVTVNNIAVWNGSEWSALNGGLNGVVYALEFVDDDLYAGGNFSFSSVSVSMAKWDGNNWTPVTFSPEGTVYALKEFSKSLYAGGDFNSVGGNLIKNLVKINESSFVDIGGYPVKVRALEVFSDLFNDTSDVLYIGGDLVRDDSTYEITGFSQWTGSQMQHLSSAWSWSLPGQQAESYISAIKIYGNRLFVTGAGFSYSPMYGYHGQNAVVFSKNVSDTVTGGLVSEADGAINAAAVFKGGILLGGDFYSLNGGAAFKLAATGNIYSAIKPLNYSPNVRVVYETAKAIIMVKNPPVKQLGLKLFDTQGKKVMQAAVTDGRVELSAQSLSQGIYLFTIYSEDKTLWTGNLLMP